MSVKIPAGSVVKWRQGTYALKSEVEAKKVGLREAQALRAKLRWAAAGEEKRKKAGERLRRKEEKAEVAVLPEPLLVPEPEEKRVEAVSEPGWVDPPVVQEAATEPSRQKPAGIDWENQPWELGFHAVAKKTGATAGEVQRAYDILMRGGKV